MNPATLPDVITLKEASAYLRLPVEAVLRQVAQGNIPGRKIEGDWRFLKTAISIDLFKNKETMSCLRELRYSSRYESRLL